ncbi:peptidoglycan -binding protein [Hwanghaeella sp.]|uniref:peptidoglycan -binding protein n=1 Tax=Hwanghaeella sp. TaxID=2605943 RepID=UPI003CCBCB7D
MALARRGRTNLDIWPGFVDALATLLMVIIFLLMIFVISQLYLNEALVGRDEALEKLNRQIADIAEQLSLEQSANEDLRSNIESLSTQLRASLAERDELQASLGALRIERNSVLARLETAESAADALRAKMQENESRLADSDALLSRTREELEDAYKVVEANKETIELQLKELDTLAEDINALTALRRELLQQVADLEALSEKQTEELTELSKTVDSQALEIGAQEEELKAKTEELALRAARLAALEKALEEKEAEIADKDEAVRSQLKEIDAQTEAVLLARAESARLREQIAALNEQIAALNQTLEASEARDKEQKAQIVDLGKRLNLALASKVQELARYRSEFFGRLREILGNRQDVRVVGDRFVFQSEVLFAQGSAELGPAGQEQLGQLADTLIQISRDIPSEINWVLRVDGHTDSVPIATARFPSNWELSTARAISVVKFLERRGIPSQRLAATGFAEFQPLDDRDDEIAYRRNRRIELKLTER